MSNSEIISSDVFQSYTAVKKPNWAGIVIGSLLVFAISGMLAFFIIENQQTEGQVCRTTYRNRWWAWAICITIIFFIALVCLCRRSG